MNRQDAAILRAVDRQREARRRAWAAKGLCPSCGQKVYPTGPYLICRNLSCKQLVTPNA